MKRVTVKIKETGDTAERDFHIFEHQVEKFVAQVRRDGGTARVVPFQMGTDLVAMLTSVGIDVDALNKRAKGV
jgi:hypothetical protein